MHRSRGQIILITLLILGTFSIIGASVVTQVVYEQKKAVLEEKTKEAYYAAESGLEDALQKILQGGSPSSQITVGDATVDIAAQEQSSSISFAVRDFLLSSGEPFFLNLNGYGYNQVRICWDRPGTSLVVTSFYTDSGGIRRTYASYAVNSTAAQNPRVEDSAGEVLVAVNVPGGNSCNAGVTTNYYVNLPLATGAGITRNYLVLWPLYQNGIQFSFMGLNGNPLPGQGTTITSQARVQELGNEVVREVRYFVSSVGSTNYNYPPAYFLSPLYSVGGVTYGPGRNW